MEGLLKIFEKQASINKDKIAIVCGGKKLSYEEIYFKAYDLSIFFKNEGLKFGDKVIIKSEETPYYWAIYFATLLADGVFISLDKNIPDNSFLSNINELGGCFVYISNSHISNSDYKHFSYEEIISKTKTSVMDRKYDLYHDIEPDRLTQIIYTTGTTGKSKGVKWPYNYQLESSFDHKELPYNQNTIIAIVAPMDHTLANGRTMTTILNGGTVLQFNDLLNLEFFYNQLDKYGVNSFVLTPSAIKYLSLISYEHFKRACRNSIFFEIGGEKMPKNSQESLLQLAPNAQLFIGYAATECGPIGFYEFSKFGTTDNRVRKVDDKPEFILFNENYESIGTPKNINGYIGIKKNFKYLGYYNSLITNLQIKDGYIILSDYGHIDEDGFLCLDGRDGETIISGGYKINPIEVENVCLKYNGVDECVCYGTSNEIFGKIVTLDVVCNSSIDKNELNDFLLKNLEINKVPKIINFVDKIEKNKMGKIDRKFYRR